MGNKISFEWEVAELFLDNGEVMNDVRFWTSGEFYDDGIGEYEWWGATYRQTHFVYEAHEIEYHGQINQNLIDKYIQDHWDELESQADSIARENEFFQENED